MRRKITVATASGTTTESVHRPSSRLMTTRATPTPTKVTMRHERRKQAVLDQRFELVDVGRHPGHDAARHLALVVVERETLQLGPDADAQRQHDPLGRPAGDEGLADLVDQVDERDDEEDGRRGEEHGLGALRDAAVDAGLDQDRAGQAGQRVDDDQDEPEEQRPAELTRSRAG